MRISKSTLLHLRIPFSLFLLPFFLFAVSQSDSPLLLPACFSFFIIHFLFYPSSNGFNSYYDKDEGSIGGLEKPPSVTQDLLIVSLALFVIALMAAFFIKPMFGLLILGIGLASKAYSHPAIRLKKYPFLGLLVVAFFQGGYTYFMSLSSVGASELSGLLNHKNIFAGSLCSFMLLGSYPITQIYQHNEDAKRGDLTVSRVLGINGTFLWTMCFFILAMSGFFIYFLNYYDAYIGVYFLMLLSPVSAYYCFKYFQYLSQSKLPDYHFVMRLNLLSSLCFILFFGLLIVIRLYEAT